MSRYVEVEPGYVCPLCPDHEDDVFSWSAILKTPICQGCNYELWNDIYGHASRPDSMLLDRLEKLTSLSYEEYSLVELESVVAEWEESDPAGQEAPEDYVAEIARLRAILKAKGNK